MSTPTPWRLSLCLNEAGYEVGNIGVMGGEGPMTELVALMCEGDTYGNAELMMRGANNHEALLAAANGINMWISNYVYAAGLDPNAVPEIQRLRAAINAAEEES